jgi:hypothetical protein
MASLNPSPAPAPSRTYTPGETNDADQMAKTLASLLDRVSMLQKNFEEIEARRTAGVPARQIESKIGMALDALSGPSVSKSADMDPSGVRPPARPTVPVAPPRPRASAPMSRGANAIAEIAARQRALDSEENPRASASVEASRSMQSVAPSLPWPIRCGNSAPIRQPTMRLTCAPNSRNCSPCCIPSPRVKRWRPSGSRSNCWRRKSNNHGMRASRTASLRDREGAR